MSEIAPFRALTYAPSLRPRLDLLIAPPYDVIDEDLRASLAARHPNNVVHIDLPRAAAGGDPHAWAADLLRRWVGDEVLQRDVDEAFYATAQTFEAPGGGTITRRGFFARVRLDPFGPGGVVPHERTFDRPRDDRLRLLRATRTHLSPVFLLHPDARSELARFLEERLQDAAFLEARDDDGTAVRVVRLADTRAIGFLKARLADSWVLIADGHHRYESALAYREERRAAGHDDAAHLLAFLCSLEDPGLRIFPIHRMLRGIEGFETGRFRERIAPMFDLEAVEDEVALRAGLRMRAGRPGVFGFIHPPGGRTEIATWREGAGLDSPAMASVPEALRRLDVILLHRLIFEGVLGLTPERLAAGANLEYAKDDREVRARVLEGKAQAGILLNPTRMDQVIEVTGRGLRLPQKTTYFHPKVPAGLLFDPLDP